MPDGTIPVKLSLRNEASKEINSTIINVPPGSHEFHNLPPGKYTVTCTSEVEVKFLFENPIKCTLTGEKNTFPVQLFKVGNGLDNRVGEPSCLGPETIIPLAAISIALLGNLGLVENFTPLFSPPEIVQSEQRQSLSGSRSRNPDNRLSSEVEARLRQCLEENIKNLLGIPSLSDLVESLNDEENPNNEIQVQVRALYARVQQLRKTIEDCDPTIIQELIVTEDRTDEQSQFHCETTMVIVGDVVNVRASPSLNSEVIGQVLYGTCVQVDTFAKAYFSGQQRLVVAGEGWYPIVLPDGRRGYIDSRYMSKLP